MFQARVFRPAPSDPAQPPLGMFQPFRTEDLAVHTRIPFLEAGLIKPSRHELAIGLKGDHVGEREA